MAAKLKSWLGKLVAVHLKDQRILGVLIDINSYGIVVRSVVSILVRGEERLFVGEHMLIPWANIKYITRDIECKTLEKKLKTKP